MSIHFLIVSCLNALNAKISKNLVSIFLTYLCPAFEQRNLKVQDVSKIQGATTGDCGMQ